MVYTSFRMGVQETVNTADFFLPSTDPTTYQSTAAFPAGRFDHDVFDATGVAWKEVTGEDSRLGGEGYWVAIERDPDSGQLNAASHNRNNSAAVAY